MKYQACLIAINLITENIQDNSVMFSHKDIAREYIYLCEEKTIKESDIVQGLIVAIEQANNGLNTTCTIFASEMLIYILKNKP
jgi:hypothetical protein